MSGAYYNEIDPDAALILRALIADGVIAPGDVDTRSIAEVQPDDIRPYTQCHFFAGGGLWSVAARMAGWPDERPLWTGSCPCQPFSIAGKGGGADDARHLWPDFFRLISAVRPAVVVGEQVAGQAGYGWFDGVRADLAREGYAGRGVDIPACAVDAPHIRSRLYWCAVADPESGSGGAGLREDGSQFDGSIVADGHGGDDLADPVRPRRDASAYSRIRVKAQSERARDGELERLHGVQRAVGDAIGSGLEGQRGHGDGPTGRAVTDRPVAAADGGADMGDADSRRARAQPGDAGEVRGLSEAQRQPELGAALSRRADGRNGSWWSDHEWIACHDGKARRAQPGVPLLVDGLSGRVGLWRVAGNAISPVLAAQVLGALMDTTPAVIGAPMPTSQEVM